MKNKLIKFFPYIVLSLILLTTYKNWFFSFQIIGGDWPYFYQDTINFLPFLPPAWSSTHGNGLGGTFLIYALDSYLYFIGWFFSQILGIPWAIVYKIFYFGMFLFLAILSVWYLQKKIFSSIPLIFKLLGIFLYCSNTYILLITSGGQMGIALAYSIAPLVLITFIKVINSIKYSLIAGVVFAVQVMFDIRIAYITVAAVILYQVVSITYQESKKNIHNTLYIILYTFVIPIGITNLLHAFWILPLLIVGNSSVNELGSIYTTAGAVKFFSFATLENTLSLLHPNWPENLFGKTYFMKTEFLLLPILAYSSLFFLSAKNNPSVSLRASTQRVKQLKVQKNLIVEQFNNKTILFFALLGLIGAFLAKGANEPFGQIYIWLFEYVPGFIMFRDPTKWYVLVGISYSVLIPFFVYSMYQWFRSKVIKSSSLKFIPNLFLILTTLYLILLVYPALSGQLSGTFQKREVPGEYILLKDKLYSDHEFYRTLWVPRQQRFTFSSNTHPSIEAEPLFSATDSASLAMILNDNKTEEYLSELSVKYVIIPYDPYGEIFADDRKYSQKKRDEYEKVLDKVTWLKKLTDDEITIYETKKYYDHFWLPKSGSISYKMISPIKYLISLNNVKEGDLLFFSENYNQHWKMKTTRSMQEGITKESSEGLNSFILPESGNYVVDIYYSAEKYYIIGKAISLVTITVLLIIFFKSKHRKI